MKKLILIAICAVFALSTQAQTDIDELKYLQNMFGMEKKQLVAERMKISDADAAKFWKLYDEYELFRSEIVEKRANNIQQYAKSHLNITDDQANELLKTTFTLNTEINALWQKTYQSMAKELSPQQAGQFIYLEMYVEALGRMKLSEMLPHIGQPQPVQK